MSTLNPAATTTRRAALSVQAAPAIETVTIRWSLSRQALRNSKAAPAFVAMVACIAEHGPDLELRWKLDLDEVRAEVSLIDPATGSSTRLTQAAFRHTIDDDLSHFEVREGAGILLTATVRTGDVDARVLYARTSLLAALGLGGGRYEVM
jgi:hypothetical protein